MRAVSAWSLVAAASLAGLVHAADAPPAAPLTFRVDEGRNINTFVRTGPVAAHLLLRSGTAPRVLVAFPAGDSGVGLWFRPTEQAVSWVLVDEPRATTVVDAKGRVLHGIVAEVVADTPTLGVQRAVLSSVRVLRDYEGVGILPDEVSVAPTQQSDGLKWSRDRLDGAAGYSLRVQALDGATISSDATSDVISARPGTRLHLKVVAVTGEEPLTPLDSSSILTPAAAADARAKNILSF